MIKLSELAEQAKFIADWHGADWSSALCKDKDGNQAHEIICESREESVISTGNNSNESSWLCDYLEMCSPENIIAIAKYVAELEQRLNATAQPLSDGWVRCSERMPGREYVMAADFKNHYPACRPNYQIGIFADWFDDGRPAWDDGDGHDLYLNEITHWMPLPAAPGGQDD